MPKVATKVVNYRANGELNSVAVSIMYDQRNGFYAAIPSEYHDVVNTFSEEDKATYKIFGYRKGKFSPVTNLIIVDVSPDAIGALMGNLITYLLSLRTTESPCILITYNGAMNNKLGDMAKCTTVDFAYLPVIKSQVGDGKPVYFKQTEDGGKGRKVNLWHGEVKHCKELPDTPELRNFLSTTWTAIVNLSTALQTLYDQPDKLLYIANTGTKLLKINPQATTDGVVDNND